MSKYIRIDWEEDRKVTSVYAVINIRTNERCGRIKWYGGFRKYVFYPTDGFLFDSECLAKVAQALDTLNVAHRKQHARIQSTKG